MKDLQESEEIWGNLNQESRIWNSAFGTVVRWVFLREKLYLDRMENACRSGFEAYVCGFLFWF